MNGCKSLRRGSANEMLVASVLISQGFNVFSAVAPSGSLVDLVVEDPATHQRTFVQVKTAQKIGNCLTVRPRAGHYQARAVDLLAVVGPAREVWVFPMALVGSRKTLSVHLPEADGWRL